MCFSDSAQTLEAAARCHMLHLVYKAGGIKLAAVSVEASWRATTGCLVLDSER